jgi:hypothetical protein
LAVNTASETFSSATAADSGAFGGEMPTQVPEDYVAYGAGWRLLARAMTFG